MKKPFMIPAKYMVGDISFGDLHAAEFYAVGKMVRDYMKEHPEVAENGADFAAQVAVNLIFDHCQVTIRNNALTNNDNR